MSTTIEAQGRTIDEAIQVALNQLGTSRDKVDIEIVHLPRAGFLGIGARRAKVRATVRQGVMLDGEEFDMSASSDLSEKPRRRRRRGGRGRGVRGDGPPETKGPEEPRARRPDAGRSDRGGRSEQRPRDEQRAQPGGSRSRDERGRGDRGGRERGRDERRGAEEKRGPEEQRPADEPRSPEGPRSSEGPRPPDEPRSRDDQRPREARARGDQRGGRDRRGGRGQGGEPREGGRRGRGQDGRGEQRTARSGEQEQRPEGEARMDVAENGPEIIETARYEPTEERRLEPPVSSSAGSADFAESAYEARPVPSAAELVDLDVARERAVQIVADLMQRMGFPSEVSAEIDQAVGEVVVSVRAESEGLLIGRRGQTLDSLEHIVNRMVMRGESPGDGRILLDIGDYRRRRREALIDLAQRLRGRAIGEQRTVQVSPMSPRDRKFFQHALAGDGDVEVRALGAGFYRRMIVAPAGMSAAAMAEAERNVVSANDEAAEDIADTRSGEESER